MPQYVLVLGTEAMDHIPAEEMPDVDRAAHAVTQEAMDADIWVCGGGLPGLVLHGDFLRHIWVEGNVFGLHVKQGTTLLFDLGVYLAVLGTVLAFLFGLTREAES